MNNSFLHIPCETRDCDTCFSIADNESKNKTDGHYLYTPRSKRVELLDLPLHFLETLFQLLVYLPDFDTSYRYIAGGTSSMSSDLTDLLNFRLTCSYYYALVNNSRLLLSKEMLIHDMFYEARSMPGNLELMAAYMASTTNWRFKKLRLLDYPRGTPAERMKAWAYLRTCFERHQTLFRDGLQTLFISESHTGLHEEMVSLLCNDKTVVRMGEVYSNDPLRGFTHSSRVSQVKLTVQTHLNRNSPCCQFKNLRELFLQSDGPFTTSYFGSWSSLRIIQVSTLRSLELLQPKNVIQLYPTVKVLQIIDRDSALTNVSRQILSRSKTSFPNLTYLELVIGQKSYAPTNNEMLDLIPESCTTLKTSWYLFRLMKPSKNVEELFLFIYNSFPHLSNDLNSLEREHFMHLAKINFAVDKKLPFENAGDAQKFFQSTATFLEKVIEVGSALEVLSVYLEINGSHVRDTWYKESCMECKRRIRTAASNSPLKVLIFDNEPLLLRDSIEASLMSRIDFLDVARRWKIRKQGGSPIVFNALL